MAELKHGFVQVNGIRIHTAEMGEGPLVLLVHGFPELWYSWRHQFAPLAEAGYRVVAYDQRGYGRSSKLWKPELYSIRHTAGDAAALVEALGEEKAVIVGHDWGAPVAWTAAWLHPERFRGVLGVSVPFSGRGLIAIPGMTFGERRPTLAHQDLAGPGQDFYQDYFGAMDAIIEELEADVRGWLLTALRGFSAEPYIAAGIDPTTVPDEALAEFIRSTGACVPHGHPMKERLGAFDTVPDWIAAADLDFYADEFERTGFAGGLSYYRSIDRSWEELEPMANQPLRVPAAFLGGQYDAPTFWGREAIQRADECIPELVWSRIMPGAGHWIQQEKPAETNAAILDFLSALP